MADPKLEMKFDPQTVRHLGVKMYSQLPAALSEIISNAYDAFATEVYVGLYEKNGAPDYITVTDNGVGLKFEEINSKFLVIGRNRRDEAQEKAPFTRAPTGKKGLGKLALFGLAKTIEIETNKGGLKNVFRLDYDALLRASDRYEPDVIVYNEPTEQSAGTTVTLKNLKRTSPFDVDGVMNSLSRIFMLDKNFKIFVSGPDGKFAEVDPNRKYRTIDIEFKWVLEKSGLLKGETSKFASLTGVLYTAEKPIPPSSGLRGITLYSRGKLVNAPEYFSESTSSHFYSYLTGWIAVDYVDELDDDLISTNRQSLVWDYPRMEALRDFLRSIVSKINTEWRQKRKEKKDEEIKEKVGIDTRDWLGTLRGGVADDAENIVNMVTSDETFDNSEKVVQALHRIVPEYADLHWRHLNPGLQDKVRQYYTNGQYGDAADQAVKIYFQYMKDMTGYLDKDGPDLVNKSYRQKNFQDGLRPKIRLNALSTDTEQNIQEGQAHLSRGVYAGFRNPVNHAPISKVVPDVFSYNDCLDVLSIVSFMMTKLDGGTVDPDVD